MPRPLPVTVFVSRTAHELKGSALTRWAHELCRDAELFSGFLGAHVATRTDSGAFTVYIGVSFSGAEPLLRWERSDERARRLAQGDELTRGAPVTVTLAEFGRAITPETTPAPSKLRSAVLIWIALFPPAAVVNAALMPQLEAWPGIARTLLLTVILVPTVVFGTLPLLQHALASRRS